ncbi:MAG: hypothetical protein IPP94_04335 [Ignavibacteria bacterium]|nr:hypothetical protein [Ignavibacteria bacterium]
MSADYFKATTSLDAGTPVAGTTYKDNIVYVWGRIAADGSFSGQSYGVSSVTKTPIRHTPSRSRRHSPPVLITPSLFPQ